MRVMGLDYGSKTVGVAVSDPLMITAQGVETVRREKETKLRQTYARLCQLINEYEVSKIVVGYPKNMDGSVGPRAKKTEEFAAQLERRTGLEIILWDERLTTVAAERAMAEAGLDRKHTKEHVDRLAAVLILQGYLDNIGGDHSQCRTE